MRLRYPRQPDQFECLGVVMGEQLRVVDEARIGEALDPLGGGLVPAGPLCPGDLGVNDVSHEGVPKGVLRLVAHAGHPRRPNQLSLLERV
jgi:hypothetical protein